MRWNFQSYNGSHSPLVQETSRISNGICCRRLFDGRNIVSYSCEKPNSHGWVRDIQCPPLSALYFTSFWSKVQMDDAYIWIHSPHYTWHCKSCKSYSLQAYDVIHLIYSYWNADYPHVEWQVVSLISERSDQQLIQRIVPQPLSYSWEYILVSPFPDECGSNLRTLHFAVLTYASVSATSIGISQDFSYYFITFINASSLLGRFAAGSISDRFGESLKKKLSYILLLDRFFSSIS